MFTITTLQELLSYLVEDFICQSICACHFDLQLLFKVLMAIYFDLTIETFKKELFTLLNSNVKELVSRQQKEKLQKTSETFRHALWSLEDFLLSWNWITLVSILVVILTLMLFLMSSLYKFLRRNIPMGLRWRWVNI